VRRLSPSGFPDKHLDYPSELSVGPLVATDDATRAARLAHDSKRTTTSNHCLSMQQPLARSVVLPPALRASGRKPAARAYDAPIAAIALATDLPLYTVNPNDFAGITGLTVRRSPIPTLRHGDAPP
jgi:tRNA(fMet)-specific endonuclease VapC